MKLLKQCKAQLENKPQAEVQEIYEEEYENEPTEQEYQIVKDNASRIHVYLYGSLAATGKGHKTFDVIESVIETSAKIDCKVEPNTDSMLKQHTNGMKF